MAKKCIAVYATALAIASLMACSDSTSNADESSPTATPAAGAPAENYSDEENLMTAYAIDVDKATGIITTHISNSKERCIKEGEEYIWKDFGKYTSTAFSKYKISGDTLRIFEFNDESQEYEEYSYMILAGNNGQTLQGTWHDTNCRDTDDGLQCKTGNSDLTRTYVFTADSMKIYAQFNYENMDFTSSYCVMGMIDILASGHGDWTLSEIFSSNKEELESTISSFNGEITSKTNNTLDFTIQGSPFSISITNAKRTMTSKTVNMTVSSATRKCMLVYTDISGKALKPYCKAENEAYFQHSDAADEMGNEYHNVWNMNNSNYDEFSECLKSLSLKK